MRKTEQTKRSKTVTKNNLLLNLSLSLFSMIFFLIILEILLAIVYPIPKYGVQDGLLTYHDATEYSFTPNFTGTHISKDFSYTIKTNSLGLNDKELFEKNFSKTTLLFIGDSVTEGYGVPQEFAYPQIVSSVNESYETVNAGVRGYGTRETVKSYVYLTNYIDPEVVIYTFVYNDLYDNLNQVSIYRGLSVQDTLPYRVITDVFLALRKTNTFRLFYYELYFNQKTFDYQASSTYRVENSKDQLLLGEFEKQLLLLKNETQQRNDTLIVVLQPWLKAYQIYEDMNYTSGDVAINEVVKDILIKHNISYIDVSSDLEEELLTQDLYFPYQDGHYTKEGNEFLAKAVTKKLSTLI